MLFRALHAVVTAVTLSLTYASAMDTLPIEIKHSEAGMVVTAGGAFFTEYHTDSAGRPVLWPLIGPTGINMTRQWPMSEAALRESTDHPHHRGMWFGYDQMNGIDFWHNPGPVGSGSGRGRIVHQQFATPAVDGHESTLITLNEWRGPDGAVVCRDERSFRFGASSTLRWIDFRIRLIPVDQPLTIGDSKEGALAVRVAGPIREDAHVGGRIVNAHGQTSKQAWGQRAPWVDYNGRIGDAAVGVAILSHPSNFRSRPRWHVRGYGLFAANPFGESDFPRIAGYKQGSVKVNVGDELRLRYQVVLHLGNERDANIQALYQEYASR